MNKKLAWLYVFAFLLFLAQTAAVSVWAPASFLIPQLTLLLVLLFALNFSLVETLWFSFFTGFLHEIYSGLIFGSQIFSFVIIAILLYLITRKLTAQDITLPTGLVLVLLSTIGFLIMEFLYTRSLGFLEPDNLVLWKQFFDFQFFWTVLVNMFFYFIVKYVFHAASVFSKK